MGAWVVINAAWYKQRIVDILWTTTRKVFCWLSMESQIEALRGVLRYHPTVSPELGA